MEIANGKKEGIWRMIDEYVDRAMNYKAMDGRPDTARHRSGARQRVEEAREQLDREITALVFGNIDRSPGPASPSPSLLSKPVTDTPP